MNKSKSNFTDKGKSLFFLFSGLYISGLLYIFAIVSIFFLLFSSQLLTNSISSFSIFMHPYIFFLYKIIFLIPIAFFFIGMVIGLYNMSHEYEVKENKVHMFLNMITFITFLTFYSSTYKVAKVIIYNLFAN